jgi:Tfp pilus assembly protein PilX
MMRGYVGNQRGAALVVGLIMLVLITIMLITALNLGAANFRSVSNMQFREEAIAASNRAIELVISSNFAASPTAQEINVDIDQDDNVDYVVQVDEPQCVQATVAEEFAPSSERYGPTLSAASTWNTVWDIRATVDPEQNAGGASVTVRAGVRALLTQAQRDTVCP